jgi:hypothetical protein
MSETERLHVIRDGLVVASLDRKDDGRLELSYSEPVMEQERC